jgi:hypothetical protein
LAPATTAFREASTTVSISELKYCFDEIITNNVTHEGERFSERMGFKMLLESDHKTVVYCQKYKDFIKAVNRL